MRGAELAFVVALGLAILVHIALTLAGELSPALARRRKAIDMSFRVALFVLVAAYLLYNLPVAEF